MSASGKSDMVHPFSHFQQCRNFGALPLQKDVKNYKREYSPHSAARTPNSRGGTQLCPGKQPRVPKCRLTLEPGVRSCRRELRIEPEQLLAMLALIRSILNPDPTATGIKNGVYRDGAVVLT
jgi:hypothetical protein